MMKATRQLSYLGTRSKLDSGLGDDYQKRERSVLVQSVATTLTSQSSFGSDEQLLQVVASVVLSECLEEIQNSSISKNDFQSKSAAMQRTIAQVSQATRIGRQVPANLTTLRIEYEEDKVSERRNPMVLFLVYFLF